MIKQIKVIMLAAIVTGCSSPPPPVPVDWDKAAAPLNTSLPQWSDNNVIVPSPTVNGKWTSSISAQSFYNTIQYGLQPYFTQSPTQHELSSLHNPALISLMPKTGFGRMEQKVLLNTSPSLIA
mgnify:FL=1